MTDWSTLEHAYGTATDILELLARAAADGDDAEEVWEELWGCLCHQGTVYTASYAAIPHLAALARDRDPAPYMEPLHLAAAILASSDTPVGVDVADVRRRNAIDLAQLEDLAVRCLALPELREDATSFIYLMQALLAFRNEPVWQERLEELANGEYEVPCPQCDQDLYLVMDDRGYFASDSDTVVTPEAPRTPLLPADPHTLDGTGAQLHRLATEHGQTDVARHLTYLFGHATCPACDATFPIADTIIADDDSPSGPPTAVQVEYLRDEDSDTEMLVIGDEDAEEWIEIQRAMEFGDQDVALGMDTYCLVNSGHATHYGGLSAWHLIDDQLRLTFTEDAARALGLPLNVALPVDPDGQALIREHLPRLLA